MEKFCFFLLAFFGIFFSEICFLAMALGPLRFEMRKIESVLKPDTSLVVMLFYPLRSGWNRKSGEI